MTWRCHWGGKPRRYWETASPEELARREKVFRQAGRSIAELTVMGEIPPDMRCVWCHEVFWSSDGEHECMKLPTREDRDKALSRPEGSIRAGEMLSGFSAVFGYLTIRTLPNGSPRSLPNLSLKLDGSTWRLTVNDNESSMYVTFQGQTWEDLFLTFEAALEAEQVPWRPSTNNQTARRKK